VSTKASVGDEVLPDALQYAPLAVTTDPHHHGGFGESGSPKNALLVECGQHWNRASAEVAIETMLRTLVDLGTLAREDAAPFLPRSPRPAPRLVEVTEAVTIRSDGFAFAQPFRGLEVLAEAGTLIGHDGDEPVRTPYDDCVLIMPSQRLIKGQTAVRLGRFLA
jgi:hypothetical protein